MTRIGELEREWAWSQIEAHVDGSLDADDAARMRAALAGDEALAAAVERARQLRAALRTLPRPAPRAGLLRRLLGIPRGTAAPWLWSAVPLLAGALAIGIALWVGAPPEPDQRAVAIQEFRVAMIYLNKTAEVTRNEVGGVLMEGFSEALTVGRGVLDDESENGG